MKAEIKEIEIFSLEQLEILPQTAKDSIVFLTDKLPQKELLILNPLVTELLKIKELEKLTYTPLPEEPTKEDKEAYKLVIDKFKEAKKSISALTSQNALAKKSIKGPLDELGKKVIAIEKSVNTIAKEVLDAIELTFKPYLDEEKIKAAAALAKREAKATEAINTLTTQNTIQSNLFKKSTLITFLKYEMLEETKTEVNNAIANYSLDKLFGVRDMLTLKTWEQFTLGQQLELLEETELTDIKASFDKEFLLFKTNINTKITVLELEKTNEKLVEQVEAIETPHVFTPAPVQNLMGATNIFEVIKSATNTPFGSGANMNTIPKEVYPTDDKNVDFLDLVIAEINSCKENIAFIGKRFGESKSAELTEQDVENLRRVRGAEVLLKRTILYILNQLPPKEVK